MVLVPKHWKSRSPPGIAAGGQRKETTHSQSQRADPQGRPFWRLCTPANGAAGWSSPVARQAHNLKVVGSNPTPATSRYKRRYPSGGGGVRVFGHDLSGPDARLIKETGSMVLLTSVLKTMRHAKRMMPCAGASGASRDFRIDR